jgi:hypothetical protein
LDLLIGLVGANLRGKGAGRGKAAKEKKKLGKEETE